jgi:uncharacterized membrane protein YebE (DUF533 family)
MRRQQNGGEPFFSNTSGNSFNDRNYLPDEKGKGEIKMNAIFRRGFNEYKRQTEIKKSFVRQTERLQAILKSADKSNTGKSSDRNEFCERSLLLLMPLVEIAWADGRVTRRETDAILRAADAYGLVKSEAGYRELMERLLSRPAPPTVGQMWQDFRYFLENLPERARQTIIFGLLAQAEFVAEQRSDSVIAFLRGEKFSQSEQEALRLVADRLEKAKEAAEEADIQKAVAVSIEKEEQLMKYEAFSANGSFRKNELATLDDYGKLIPLVPLVKTAWAEGRITKRERRLIFEAAARMGIEPDTANHKRLSDWLELRPTEELYGESLERLNADWGNLPEEEKVLRRLDLLSDCVNIAEASGGAKNFPSGGVRICDEEFAAVKRIAQKLNAPSAPLSA